MILNYSTINEQSSTANMSDWLAILQKNSKSSAQLQSEMIQEVSDTIKDIQDKAIEKAKDALKNTESDENISDSDSETEAFDGAALKNDTCSENSTVHVDIKV